MQLVHVWEDQKDKPNYQFTHADRRSPHVLHGYRNDDPKIKIIKVGINVPAPGKQYLKIQSGKEVYEQEAHSPVRNYYSRILQTLAGFPSTINSSFQIRQQDNILYSSSGIIAFNFNATEIESTATRGFYSAVNSDIYGIVLGTGNTAWTLDDYKPETLISQGVAAGKLIYSATTLPLITYSGGVWTVIIRRLFDNFNADANTITVKEVCRLVPYWNYNRVTFSGLEERTVLMTTRNILYKHGAVFTYTVLLTIPDITVMLPNAVAMLLSLCAGVNNYDVDGTYGSGHRCMKDTGGNVRSANNAITKIAISSSAMPYSGTYSGTDGDSSTGAVAGSGNTAVAEGDYALAALYPNGSDINQLTYHAQTNASIIASYDAVSKTFTITQTRVVTNDYSIDQIVREVGLIGNFNYATNTVGKFLISRTVLDSPITLSAGESLGILHDFNMTHL